MKIGIDLLAGYNYPKVAIQGINQFYKLHKEKIAVGVLWKAEGWSTEKAIQWTERLCNLKTKAVDTIRVNGLWLDNHNFKKENLKECLDMAKKVKALAIKYPSITFYYAPTLEHKMSLTLAQEFANAITKELDGKATFVNSYIEGGARLPRYLNEQHHNEKAQANDIFSFDGIDQQDADVRKYFTAHTNATLFMSWCFPFNQRYSSDPTKDSTPRAKRKLTPPVWFITAMITQLHYLKYNIADGELPKDKALKMYAECEPVGGFKPLANNGTLLPRSLKPVYLSDVDVPEIKLRSKRTRKVVCKLKREKWNNDHKKWIYREVGSKTTALDLHKIDPVMVLIEGSREYIINPLFRSGTYRNS